MKECKGLLVFQMPLVIDLTQLTRKEEVFEAYIARTLQTGLGEILGSLGVCKDSLDCGDKIRSFCQKKETAQATGNTSLVIWPVDATRYVRATLNGKMDFRTTPPNEDSDIKAKPKTWIWDATPQDDLGDLRLRLEGRNDTRVPTHDIGIKLIKPSVKKSNIGVTRTWFNRINEFLQTPIGEKVVLYSIIGLCTTGAGLIVTLIRRKIEPTQNLAVTQRVIERIFFVPRPPSPRGQGGAPPPGLDEDADKKDEGGKWIN